MKKSINYQKTTETTVTEDDDDLLGNLRPSVKVQTLHGRIHLQAPDVLEKQKQSKKKWGSPISAGRIKCNIAEFIENRKI